MKKTMKAVRAATIIAQKYGVKLPAVLANEPTAEGMYLELRADGYEWDEKVQRWGLKTDTLVQPLSATLKRLKVQIRVMAEDEVSAIIADGYIQDALTDAGFIIEHAGAVKKNYGGEGARLYLEVSL